jgi:hypothetical protein
MAASSEVRFKIGADTSALSRAFVQAETIAAAAGQQIHKKLGMKDAFKSGVLALGLSIEKISEKIAAIFTGGDPEKWKSALDAANDSARIIEESTLRRMSTVRQIAELEKKIARNAAQEDAALAEERLEEARRKGADTAELELELIAKVKRYRDAIADGAKTLAESRKKDAEDERTAAAKALEAEQKLSAERGKAAVAVNEADQANQTAKRDALAFTIDEAAAGKRGNRTDAAQAKAIRRDETTARKLFDTGNTVTQFDFKTGKNVQRGAEFFQDRALQLRGEFSKTKSGEQAPFAGTEKRLDDAIEELRALNEKLVPESVD